MRRVQLNENHKLLKQYHAKILIPFFDLLVQLKKGSSATFVLHIPTIKGLSLVPTGYPLDILLTTNGKVRFTSELTDLLNKHTLADIEEEQRIFLEQNLDLEGGKIPKKYPRNDYLYKIFSRCFYEKLFDSELCWSYIKTKGGFDRKKFHHNFRKNNKAICPLCDIDTIIAKSNSSVEHFLPRNKFPYLSMNSYNLVPSCDACNKAEQGKGQNVYLPIVTPYTSEIGNDVKFDIAGKKTNYIKLIPAKISEVQNFAKTVKLEARYKTRDRRRRY